MSTINIRSYNIEIEFQGVYNISMKDRGDGNKQIDFGQWSRILREKNRKVLNVYETVGGIIEANQDVVVVNGNGKYMTLTTDFDVVFDDGTIPFRLSVRLTKPSDDNREESVMLRQIGENDDSKDLSYRLDVRRGKKVDGEHKRAKDANGAVKTLGAALSFGRDASGQVNWSSDNYTETNVKSDGAQMILDNAANFRRPDGYWGDPTLRELRNNGGTNTNQLSLK